MAKKLISLDTLTHEELLALAESKTLLDLPANEEEGWPAEKATLVYDEESKTEFEGEGMLEVEIVDGDISEASATDVFVTESKLAKVRRTLNKK